MTLFTRDKIGQVRLLPVSEISANPYQPRKQFSEQAIAELAQSIAMNGLLQPITVRRVGEGYELIAGERRLMACRHLGMDKVPALLEGCTDEQSAVFALIENLQRQDLNFFEQAQAMQHLMKQCGLTQELLARQLGKAQSTVANKLRLLVFSPALQERMLRAGLTERHARALLQAPCERWAALVEVIIANSLNVSETEALVCTASVPEAPVPEGDLPKGRRKKKGIKLFLLKDFRIFKNTIDHAISTMKLAGIQIESNQNEDDEYILYTMRIPKKSVYRAQSGAAAASAGTQSA